MSNDELLKTYLVDTLEFVKTSKDVIKTEGSLYVKEVIQWEITSGLIAVFISLIIIMISLYVFKVAKKEKDLDCWADTSVIRMVLSSITILISLVVLTVNGLGTIKAYTSPRVIIIEKLQRAMR